MVLRNYPRDHPDFKDVFAIAYKGIQCAFVSVLDPAEVVEAAEKLMHCLRLVCKRKSMGREKLDKDALHEIIRRHVEMYIPPR